MSARVATPAASSQANNHPIFHLYVCVVTILSVAVLQLCCIRSESEFQRNRSGESFLARCPTVDKNRAESGRQHDQQDVKP